MAGVVDSLHRKSPSASCVILNRSYFLTASLLFTHTQDTHPPVPGQLETYTNKQGLESKKTLPRMTRPIASSGKKRRAQLQTKRATKRGESPPPSAVRNGSTSIRYAYQKGHVKKSGDAEGDSRKLQSRFIALTPEYLERTRNLAHSTVLQRPLPGASAIFPAETILCDEGRLSVPARPKFKYGQTKREVERNEEGVFRKWLAGQREVVRRYVEGAVEADERQEQDQWPDREVKEDWPRSSSWFETNLEVWRQL